MGLPLHGRCIGLHGQCIAKHGQCIGLHGQCIGLHGQCIGLHGQCIDLHGQCIGLHGGAASRRHLAIGFDPVIPYPFHGLRLQGRLGLTSTSSGPGGRRSPSGRATSTVTLSRPPPRFARLTSVRQDSAGPSSWESTVASVASSTSS